MTKRNDEFTVHLFQPNHSCNNNVNKYLTYNFYLEMEKTEANMLIQGIAPPPPKKKTEYIGKKKKLLQHTKASPDTKVNGRYRNLLHDRYRFSGKV